MVSDSFEALFSTSGTLNFEIDTKDALTNENGKAIQYEGEIHKVSKKAYGRGKAAHAKRPDISWEGTWIDNKRTGFRM